MRAKGLQASAEFKLVFQGTATLTLVAPDDGQIWHCVSFTNMFHLEREMRELQKLKIAIDEHHNMSLKDHMSLSGGYNDFFNFGLNTTNWRLFVNKQILMRYERLFIERQMNDINNERRKLEQEIRDLKGKIEDTRQQTETIKQRMRGETPDNSSRSGGGGHMSHHHRGVGGGGRGGYGHRSGGYKHGSGGSSGGSVTQPT
jgi:hypothetical protein